MQTAILPASAGWFWIREGLRLFLKQPLTMLAWAMLLSLLVLFAIMLIPVGPLLLPILMPMLVVMTLAACQHVAQDRFMLPALWIQPLRLPGVRGKLLRMGLLFAGLCIVAQLLAVLPFYGAVMRGVERAAATQDTTALLDALQPPLALYCALAVPLAAAFWHAPILAAWHGLRITQALFYSWVACWRNKWAFLAYGATWVLIFLFIDRAADLLAAAGLPSPFVGLLQTPIDIILGAVLYCSLYPAYTSVFRIKTAA